MIAETIIAEEHLPSYDRSPLDGYALHAADLHHASRVRPVSLPVTEKAADRNSISRGEAARVTTGMSIPAGADCVIRREHTICHNGHVKLLKKLKPGDNIICAGEDIKKGTVLFTPGDMLTPPRIGLLAALGYAHVKVFTAPYVQILSTGNDLVPIDEENTPGKTRDCNSYSLYALVEEYGGKPASAGVVKDQLDDLCSALDDACAQADIIITTGGVSVGENDLVPTALKRIGARHIFWKVAMKPGSPLLFAKKGEKIFFALSGNPAACIVAFEQFVGPALLRMQGVENCCLPRINGVLTQDFQVSPGKVVNFIRSYCFIDENNRAAVTPLANQRPGSLQSLSAYNCYLVMREELNRAAKGDVLPVQLVPRKGHTRANDSE